MAKWNYYYCTETSIISEYNVKKVMDEMRVAQSMEK